MTAQLFSRSLLIFSLFKISLFSPFRIELKAMMDFVKKDFSPKKDSLVWAKKVIGENTSVKAKMLMYCNEIGK